MPIVSTRKKTQSTDDMTSDFACVKMSALMKACRISANLNFHGEKITIGPNSTINENENESDKTENIENIENEQNSCSTKVQQKPNHPQNKILMQKSFSINKIIMEREIQRKEEVQKVIKRHLQHMKQEAKTIQDVMIKSCSDMAEERERRSKENYASILEEEKIAEEEEIRKRHEREEELEEYKKRTREKEELMTKILILRNQYKIQHHELTTIFEECNDQNTIKAVCADRLENLNHIVNIIDEKLKIGDVTDIELAVIQKVIDQVQEMILICESENDRINLANSENTVHADAQVQDSQQQEPHDEQVISDSVVQERISTSDAQSNAQIYEEQQTNVQTENATLQDVPEAATPIPNAEENVSTTAMGQVDLFEYVDRDSLELYVKSQKFLKSYSIVLNEFSQSAATKQFRFECQKAINIPVNAISGINGPHLTDKYERLHTLLIGKSWPNVKQHPQGAAFCKNILAKKIVSQGETLISSKPKMAFPIAAVVVALWNDHADFGDLLLSHFHDVCPFTVPVFLPQMVGQTDEDHYKIMGYKYAEDGTVEKHDKYLKRMSGLMRLYASITITSQRKGIAQSNPFGLQNAWRWLAAVLNIEPRKEITDLCATLLLDMLEVAGNILWIAYPKQFRKLLILLTEEYYPRMQNVGSIGGGPLVRLEEFLNNTLRKGSIPPPDGQLPPNFW